MDILYVIDNDFWEKSKGSEIRIYREIEVLDKKKMKIGVFLLRSISEEKKVYIEKLFENVEIVYYEKKKLFKVKEKLKKIKFFRYLNSKKIKTIKSFYSKRRKDIFNSVILKYSPKNIVIEYIRNSYLIEEIEKISDAVKFIDTHDIQSERYKNFKENKYNSEIKITLEEEESILKKFDYILTITERDKEQLITKTNIKKEKIITLLHYIEKIDYSERQRKHIKFAFIGTKGNHNEIGLLNFLNNVWENLLLIDNTIEFNIFGNICENITIKKKNINLIGFVDDLETVYKENDIFINPVLFGSGLKIKNIEALSYGKVLITTDIGKQGLEKLSNSFLIGNSNDELQKKCEYLLKNKNLLTEIGKNGYLLVKDEFSVEKIYKDFFSKLKVV